MAFITIDIEKCKQDGHCAQECPSKLITLDTASKYPEAIPGAALSCIKCGHCVVVCPHSALSMDEIKPEACAPVISDLNVNELQLEQLIKSRRSVRNFKKKKIEKATFSKLIEISRYAPTGSNSQQVQWLVINSPEKVADFAAKTMNFFRLAAQREMPPLEKRYIESVIRRWDAGHDIIFRNAPALVIAYAPAKSNSALVDSTLALSYLDLTATGFGLGCCWAGFFMRASANSPEIQAALNLPEGNALMGALMIGYPKNKFHRVPPRKEAQVIWME